MVSSQQANHTRPLCVICSDQLVNEAMKLSKLLCLETPPPSSNTAFTNKIVVDCTALQCFET